MRVLAAIAHHGSKNRPFLERMVASFRGMAHNVDIVVLTEQEKSLPEGVEQVVGLPSEDPWSLPFGHRRIFAERRNDYDVFLYSEDDILIEQHHLDAFLELSDLVPSDLLPGFMRYEVTPAGERSYDAVHGFFRWDPTSVLRIGDLTFANFTNEHSACYALTRRQLARAIASGKFLVAPHEGWYDMLVSAATDVYRRCGFDKVLCLERLDELLVHHMPDVYLDRFGVDERTFNGLVDGVYDLAQGRQRPSELFHPETRMRTPFWAKHLYTPGSDRVISLLPKDARRVLCLGATTGDLEATLIAAGFDVAALPIDPVFASLVRSRGITCLSESTNAGGGWHEVGPFDVLLAIDAVGYLPDPVTTLASLRPLLRSGAKIIMTAPDHERYVWRNRLMPWSKPTPVPGRFEEDGIHRTSARVTRGWLHQSGATRVQVRRRRADRSDPVGRDDLPSRLLGNVLVTSGDLGPDLGDDADAGITSRLGQQH